MVHEKSDHASSQTYRRTNTTIAFSETRSSLSLKEFCDDANEILNTFYISRYTHATLCISLMCFIENVYVIS